MFEGNVRGSLAWCHRALGDFTKAERYYIEALAIAGTIGDRHTEGIMLGHIAWLRYERGDAKESLEYYLQSIQIYQEIGNRQYEGIVLGSCAILDHEQGRFEDAKQRYQQALVILREVGNRRGEGITLGKLGDLLLEQQDLAGSQACLGEAIEICDELLPHYASCFRVSLALLHAQQGNLEEARSHLALAKQYSFLNRWNMGKTLCNRALAEHLVGDALASAATLTEAETFLAELEGGRSSALRRAIADVHAQVERSHGHSQ